MIIKSKKSKKSETEKITALKYFCEETPEYHIAAAGSLLGVVINRNQYSFPVGKVETMELFPMDFEDGSYQYFFKYRKVYRCFCNSK